MRIFRIPPRWRKLVKSVPGVLGIAGMVLGHLGLAAGFYASLAGAVVSLVLLWLSG